MSMKNPYAYGQTFDLEPPVKKYSIFDTPDQDDAFKKIYVWSARAFIYGTVGACSEMILLSKPSSPMAILGRYSSIMFPIVSIGAAYPAIVSVSANLRKKDDQYNHFWGGVVAGSIWGARLKSQNMAWGLGISLGILALCVKKAKMEGIQFMAPQLRYKEVGSFHHYHRTFIPGLKGRRPIETMDTPDRGIDSL